jgi:hypothetical protein
MTTFVITKGTTILYRTQSWPRFIVMLDTLKHDPEIATSTTHDYPKEQPQ